MFRIGKALDVARLHGDDGSGDVANARNGDKKLECTCWPEPRFEILFQLFLVACHLQILLVIHQKCHAVLFRDRTLREEVGKS